MVAQMTFEPIFLSPANRVSRTLCFLDPANSPMLNKVLVVPVKLERSFDGNAFERERQT